MARRRTVLRGWGIGSEIQSGSLFLPIGTVVTNQIVTICDFDDLTSGDATTNVISRETSEYFIERLLVWFTLQANIGPLDEPRGFRPVWVALTTIDTELLSESTQVPIMSGQFHDNAARVLRTDVAFPVLDGSAVHVSGDASLTTSDTGVNGQFARLSSLGGLDAVYRWDIQQRFSLREDQQLALWFGVDPQFAEGWQLEDQCTMYAVWKFLAQRRRT